MSELANDEYMHYFKRFLDEHIDCRLETMLTEDDRTANHENRTTELERRYEDLESKVEELESQIEYASDHEDRICELESELESVDRTTLLKDATALIDRRIHELASRGQLRIYVASTDRE